MNGGPADGDTHSVFSIVTIHLDDVAGLARTRASVEPLLPGGRVEWILVDGGSRRDTVAAAQQLDVAQQRAAHFVSEPDEGIYHAMNKGTALAHGVYVLYLNAGDELQPGFEPDPFVQAAEQGPAMIWGNCTERYAGGQMVPVKTRSARWAWYGMPACHPAIFFNRQVIGTSPYDTSYAIAADYDLVCRLLTAGQAAVHVDEPVSIFHRGGVSDARSRQTRAEENRVRMRYFDVPAVAGHGLRAFKAVNRQLSKIAWLRRLWRGRI